MPSKTVESTTSITSFEPSTHGLPPLKILSAEIALTETRLDSRLLPVMRISRVVFLAAKLIPVIHCTVFHIDLGIHRIMTCGCVLTSMYDEVLRLGFKMPKNVLVVSRLSPRLRLTHSERTWNRLLEPLVSSNPTPPGTTRGVFVPPALELKSHHEPSTIRVAS